MRELILSGGLENLGMAGKSKAEQQAIAEAGAEANKVAALERLTDLKLNKHIADALAAAGSLRKAAAWLNERNITSPLGGRWHAPSLLKAAKRLGLR